MLPALKHRPRVNLLLAHRRHYAARIAAIGVSAVDDGLLVHLKRIVARPVVALRLCHGPECGRLARGEAGTRQKAKDQK